MILAGLFLGHAAAQTSTLAGTVTDATTGDPLEGAAVVIDTLKRGAFTDSVGRYELRDLPRGTYTVRVNYLGYAQALEFNFRVDVGANQLNLKLQPQNDTTEAVEVRGAKITKNLDQLSSTKAIGIELIRANPGGDQDISRVVQSLPGVGGSVGFRNDLIIRGGAPNENVFYLDGVEIPNINHFATQGSGGGPQGILNSTLISNVTFQSSGFSARYDNTLSSVLDFELAEGNKDRFQTQIQVGAQDASLTFDTPLNKKKTVTGLFSGRYSYLQGLFQLLQLPFLPTYTDFQTKVKWDVNEKNSLTLIGLGAIDRFRKNDLEDVSEELQYVLDGLPLIQQNTYTVGVVWRRLTPKGYFRVAASRNWLDNQVTQEDVLNPEQDASRFRAQEAENKLRYTATARLGGGWQLNWGAVLQYATYDSEFFDVLTFGDTTTSFTDTLTTDDRIDLFRWGAYVSIGRAFFNNRLKAQLGLRTDMNSFTDGGLNPLPTLSPRLSLSFALTEKWFLNASGGVYYKLPPYTLLGFRGQEGQLTNENLDYIRSTHAVLGVEFKPSESWTISVDGFFKYYQNYPVSTTDGISLANRGVDFGVYGNEDAVSTGEGRTYGVEFFTQKFLTKRLYGTVSYTLFRSEFSGADGEFVRAAWDVRHLVAVTGGIRLDKKNTWEIAVKYRFQGGNPFTPYDLDASIPNYLVTGEPVLDYTQFNAETTPVFMQLDLRVDKRWYFRRWSLNLYFELQNATNWPNEGPDDFTLERTADGSAFVQPYNPVLVNVSNGQLIPVLGVRIKL